MTPEMVEYYRAMLLVGFRDRLDAAFDHGLETEEPLSDLMLSLSTCISDDNQVLSVLKEYTLLHTYDERLVFQLVLEDVSKRFRAGEMSRSDVCLLLQRIIAQRETFWIEPWQRLTNVFYALELSEEGIISEDVFNQCFDAWWYRGECLDAWELRRQQHAKPKKRRLFDLFKK